MSINSCFKYSFGLYNECSCGFSNCNQMLVAKQNSVELTTTVVSILGAAEFTLCGVHSHILTFKLCPILDYKTVLMFPLNKYWLILCSLKIHVVQNVTNCHEMLQTVTKYYRLFTRSPVFKSL